VDYDEMSRRYDAGRHLDDWQVEPLYAVISAHLPSPRERLLDLGSGTGQWSGRLARWFGVDVIGVEPSSGMREHAIAAPRVAYVAGAAERLPLRDASVAAAWLSVVVHHFDDLHQAALEVGRVVRPGGSVLLRTAVPDLMPREPGPVVECVRAAGKVGTVTYAGLHFPTSLSVIDTFPSLAELDDAFGEAGFARVDARLVAHGQARSMREFRDKVAVRADSTLVPVPEDEWRRGLAELDEMVAAETEPTEVWAAIPFVAYRCGPAGPGA
jgi:ubiquinone/menaquinone biosynthesis C-methylase UbiE